MTPRLNVVKWLCRIYSAMLYSYPRQFRHEYGGDMRQVFRDRCREYARAERYLQLTRFSAVTALDWIATTVREGIDAVQKPGQRGFITEWTLTIIMYLFVSTTLVQAYVVPTGSMESTVRVGDHMLVERIDRSVHRGDIVVFLYPEDVRQTWVKRVIGLPGDHIRLMDKQVIRNGHRLLEPYTQHVFPQPDSYRDDFPTSPQAQTSPRGVDMFAHHIVNGEVLVPPDTLFVMGDNRDNSLDSRYWGFLPRDYIVGKPALVYWSFDASTDDLEHWSFAHVFDVTEHFFTRTRWRRTLLVPRSRDAQTE